MIQRGEASLDRLPQRVDLLGNCQGSRHLEHLHDLLVRLAPRTSAVTPLSLVSPDVTVSR